MDTSTVILLSQAFIDLVLVGCIAALYLKENRNRRQISAEKWAASLSVLEKRATQQEEDWARLKEKLESQIRRLTELGDGASEILARGQQVLSTTGRSQEEQELAALTKEGVKSGPAAPLSEIPRLEELEKSAERIRDGHLDLKTLLKEQLV